MNKKGFTLIELIIALSIVAFIFVSILWSTRLIWRGEERSSELNQIYQMARVTMERISSDFNMAFLVTNKDFLGVTGEGGEVKTAFIGVNEGGLDSVNFNTLGHFKMFYDAKESDQAEVGYYAENDPEKENLSIIMRRESSYLDDDVEEGGVAYPVAKGVSKFELSYYDGKKYEWKDTWNSESLDNKNQLPRAVKVLVSFRDPLNEEKEIIFMTISFIELWKEPIEF